MAEPTQETKQEPTANNEEKLLFVKSTHEPNAKGENKFVVWDKDNPVGEVYIADTNIHKVGATSAIKTALNSGDLEEVSAKDYQAQEAEKKKKANE